MSNEGWIEKLTMDQVPYYFNEVTEEVSWDKPNALKSREELSSESGRWRWLPDDELAWIPGREVSRNPNGTVECINDRDETVVLPKNAPDWPILKSSLTHLEEDLVLVDNMNEGLIIHNLRERFKLDQIYTNIGTILISVNPFKRLPLYTPSMMETYYRSGGNKRLPPHIFGIADAAYKSMFYDKKDQSILISGESGAGKTEATKQCLAFFAEVAGSENNVEQKIIQANPILEAFGNAKTVRNNNSSRFGKYMEIHFDRNGKIVGARTENYLLEKSRVVYQAEGERNFHIFYQLVVGKWASKYGINQELDTFNYLNQSGTFEAEDINDVENFDEVLESLQMLGFSDEEIEWLFSTTAAVLKLGNVEFKGTPDGLKSLVVNKPIVGEIAKLLRVDAAKLEEAILSRWFVVRGQEPTKIPFKPTEAKDACAALAKAIYGNLFDWLVQRINASVAVSAKASARFIGVLDIFGFEIFEMNSFEQLCINFANEKLQQHFNQYTFKLEEKVYAQEKISFVHIEFIDNQPILDLIEKKPAGLLVLLDEEIVMPKGTDETWSAKILQTHGKNEHFERIIKKSTAFIIHHYAGAVRYDAEGFLSKNRDTMYQDLYDVLSESKHALLASIFPKLSENRKKISLGGQFRTQLNNLMDKLNQTQPHYVRCVKPNSEKEPNNFQSVMSLEQLRYAGVFEAIRIRQQGYPFRYSHKEFVRRYKCLALKENGWLPLKSKTDKELCKELLAITKQDFSTIQIGVSQVLYRAPQQRILELLRNLALERVCVVSQAWTRRMLAQLFTRRLKQVRPVLRDALKTGDDLVKTEKALHHAHKVIGTLVNVFGFQLYEITLCKILLDKLIERKRVSDLLEKIFPKDPEVNFDELSNIVAQGDAIADYPGTPKQMKLYQDTKAKLELTINRRATRAELKDATEHADKHRINAAIQRAKELGIETCLEVGSGRAMLDRIVKEESVINNIKIALQTGGITSYSDNAKQSINVQVLEPAIAEGMRFGMKTAEGKFILNVIIQCKKLRTLLQNSDWTGCSQWLPVETLFASDEMTEELLQYDELAWANYETQYRNQVRDIIEPLQISLSIMNDKEMKAGLSNLQEQDPLGPDQTQRLQKLKNKLIADVDNALQLLKSTKEQLKAATESEDEDQLIDAIKISDTCPVNAKSAVHLLERYVTAHILLALKFHMIAGIREEVGLMLDEMLADATSAKVRTSKTTAQLRKEAIISELEVQSKAINDAMKLASTITFKTDEGKLALKKGEASKGLRDNLLQRNWDKVEYYLNIAGSLQLDSPDVQLARDEVAGRAAAEDVLQKIEKAIADVRVPAEDDGHPSEGILQTSLAQADRLQMKRLPAILSGQEMYDRILHTRRNLQEALEINQYDDYIKLAEEYGQLYQLLSISIAKLNDAIQDAESFQYDTKEVRDARHLLEEFTILTNLQTNMQTGGYLEGSQPQSVPGNYITLEPLSGAYAPTDGFELTTELSHYIVTKAYHIICIRGAIQVLPSDHTHLDSGIKEAERPDGIGFETPELVSARELMEVTLDILHRMQHAEQQVEQALLEDAVATAEKYYYENDNVQRVRELRDRVIELNEESRNALWNMDKARMQQVLADAKAIRLTTKHFEKIEALLNLSEEDFLKLEIKKAKEVNDVARKIRLAIRLKEIALDTYANLFSISQCKALRTPKDFAALKLVTTDRKKLAMGMMHFTKNVIHTSLSDFQDPLLIKVSLKTFKNVLGYMGDKKYPYPTTCAQEIITLAYANPGVRGEVYAQIIKQLNEHPVPQNKQKGYHLLAICCKHFPPTPDFENHLELYLRNVPEMSSKYIAVLRDIIYGGIPAGAVAPSADQLDSFVNEFFNAGNPRAESKFCVPQPIITTKYTQEFFDDPENLFLKIEID